MTNDQAPMTNQLPMIETRCAIFALQLVIGAWSLVLPDLAPA
jgi:hypothetical protein